MFKDVEQKFIPVHVATTYPSSLVSSGLSKSFSKNSMFPVFCSAFFHFPALPSNCPPHLSCPNITLLMRSLASSESEGYPVHMIIQELLLHCGPSVWVLACVYVCSLTQLCPTLCDSMDYSVPGSSVHGILQARVLEWSAMPSSSWSPWPMDQTHISFVSCIGRQVLHH